MKRKRALGDGSHCVHLKASDVKLSSAATACCARARWKEHNTGRGCPNSNAARARLLVHF